VHARRTAGSLLSRVALVFLVLTPIACGGDDSTGGGGAASAGESPEVAPVDGVRAGGAPAGSADFRVLAFAETSGFRHESIPDTILALEEIGKASGFGVDTTASSTIFDEAHLATYRVVVFASTLGDVLAPNEKAALERFVRQGGGFVGLHSAADTEHSWPFYGELIGAWFVRHPPGVQRGTVVVEDHTHPATKDLPATWQHIDDEWYEFDRNPRANVHVLLRVDEGSYTGGTMGPDHPITWTREIDQGRSFMTSLGHTSEAWREPELRTLVRGGILWAARR
jgi:cytochrome c